MTRRRVIPSTENYGDIPTHWVRLTTKYGKKTQRYNAVYQAIQSGEISEDECIKFRLAESDPRGPIYVDPAAAERALLNRYARKQQPPPIQSGSCVTLSVAQFDSAFDCFNAAAGSLERMEKLLERLASAVEAIATQPMTPHDRMVATVETNGFHN